jgi:ABC-type branched-subunit amino acid transport system ATPase component
MANSRNDILVIDNLQVNYGQARALQGVSLTLGHGVLAVVGRNGMGKTSLCNAVTGMVKAEGLVIFDGQDILGLPSHRITRLGIAYVPQGRRVWRSLTVDEHLQLAARTARKGEWTVARVYDLFPRLAERRRNGGAQLSGGEQQMLAIARALLFNPRLLVMDEPTEGLAPVIVEQVAGLIRRLAGESDIPVLLIEQNLGVALSVAEQVAVMVNGKVATIVASEVLKNDRQMQESLLGVKSGGREDDDAVAAEQAPAPVIEPAEVFRLVRSHKSASDQQIQMPLRTEASVVAPRRDDGRFDADRILVIGDSAHFKSEMAYVRGSVLQQHYRVRTADITLATLPSMADIGPTELESYAIRAGVPGAGGDIRSKAGAIHAGLARLVATQAGLRAVVAFVDAGNARALCQMLAELGPEVRSVLLAGPGVTAGPAPTALFDYRPPGPPGAVDRERIDLAIGALSGMLDARPAPLRAEARAALPSMNQPH